MDFNIPENLTGLLDRVKLFVKQSLEPLSRQVEEQDHIPEEVVRTMREMGLFGLAIPRKYGGLGIGTFGECLVYEELSKVNACFRTRVSTNNGIGSQGIIIDGTEEQKQKYLPRLASGEWTGCFALSEAEAGSDAANIQTRAERQGDYWLLNGRKHFITNGDVADLASVFAVTDESKRAKGGITAFLVEKTFPGYSLGVTERKMGMRGSHVCEILFDNCKVPVANVIGGESLVGQGFKTAMKTLDKGRLTMGASALGSAQRLLELSLDYVRKTEKSGSPLSDLQSVQFRLADMATQIYAARQMLYHAAWLRDKKGTAVVKEAAMVKLFCTEMAGKVAETALQIHGILGFTQEYPVERFYRDLRLTRIYEGTSEIQRLVIARELAKL